MIKKFCSLWILTGLASACSTNPADVPVVALHASQYCPFDNPGVSILQAGELAQWVSGTTPSLHNEWPGPQAAEVPQVPAGYHLLLIRMGQKSTGGYSLELNADRAKITKGVLQLPVLLVEPQPDTLVTQQITSPCLVLGVAPGPYKKARVAPLQNGELVIDGAKPADS